MFLQVAKYLNLIAKFTALETIVVIVNGNQTDWEN